MSDTARSYQPKPPATTEGLDDFFASEVKEGRPQGLPEELPLGVPVELAALKLGLTDRAVLKRLRRGTLKGFKTKTKYGDKWLVLAAELPEGLPQGLPGDSLATIPLIPDIEQFQEKGDSQSRVPGDSRVLVVQDQGLPPVQSPELDRLCELVADLQERLDKANQQLQGATFRNGYLESKLEDKEQQILLLTDRQTKQSWWANFSAWFLGRR
mgnify:CR=1 FL=1